MIEREESDAEVLRRGERGAAAWRRRLRRGDDEGRPTNLHEQATLAGRAAADRDEPEDLAPVYPLRSLEAAWIDGHRARMSERRAEAKARAEAEAARLELARVEAERKANDAANAASEVPAPKRKRRARRW